MLECIITFSILPKFGTYVINKGRGMAFFLLLGLELRPTQKHSDQSFHPIFLTKFPDFPWVFGTQVPWLSLTLTRNELQGSHIFQSLNSRSFKEIPGENLHKFQGYFTHDVCLS